jgi:hypothetical protein
MESQQESVGVGIANVMATIINIRDEGSMKNLFKRLDWQKYLSELPKVRGLGDTGMENYSYRRGAIAKLLCNYSKSLDSAANALMSEESVKVLLYM